MKIEHIALWVHDLEAVKDFYVKYFGGRAGEKYHNSKRNFSSYFISFEDGARLELMSSPDMKKDDSDPEAFIGRFHFAISVGSKAMVDHKTEELKSAGYKILLGPRTTGDGYYETEILDPEGNRVEVTV